MQENIQEQQIISHKHLRPLHYLLREEKTPLFNLLSKDYGVDLRDVSIHLFNNFIKGPTNGTKHLFDFTKVACSKACPSVKNWIVTWTTQLLSSLGWYVFDVDNVEEILDRPRFYRDTLHFFRSYNMDLQDPAKVVDVSNAKDILSYVATLLRDMCEWDETLASELAEELLPFGGPNSPTVSSGDIKHNSEFSLCAQDLPYRPTLVSNAWKFKLLRKYVVKGRMELRVISINTMDLALVEIWKEYNTSVQGTHHTVMQYLAQFLLEEQLTEYIISVDSHPQLIQRSGNIVGFLVVTHRYSEKQTNVIWETVSESQDPRVVSATLSMLRSITGLMDVEQLLYFCTKLYDVPIEKYSIDTLRFLRDISDQLRPKVYDWRSLDHKQRPWNVCIRLIQDTSPSRQSTKRTTELHREAWDQLTYISNSIGPEERHQIFSDCATHIARRSSKATGSVHAITIICSNPHISDVTFFKENLEVTRQILQELCFFVKSENYQGIYQYTITALEYRLDILRFLVLRAPEAIPTELYSDIWDHVIGKHALNNDVRDMAWARFSEAVKYKPDNEFCKQLVLSYVPELEPQYFTRGLYDFVATYKFPTTKQRISTDEGDKELLQIPGADLLWRIILTAPTGTIEGVAAKLLAARYLEVDTNQGVSLEEVEDAHVALVEKCAEELLLAYKTLRGKSKDAASLHVGDSMDITLSDAARQQTELRFARTLLFQKRLLEDIRKKPEFGRTPRSDSKIEDSEPELVSGDSVEIKYNIPSTSEKQTMFLGTENTLRDLETRLCVATRFTKINLFASGQRLDLVEKASQTLAELGLAPRAHVLVQKAAGSGSPQPMPDSSTNHSVFEMTLLNHFEALFACMDSDDNMSRVVSSKFTLVQADL